MSRDDIPEAYRHTTAAKTVRPRPLVLIGVGAIALLLLLLLGVGLASRFLVPLTTEVPASPPTSPQPTPTSSPTTLLGHFPYPEAPASQLQSLKADAGIKLRQAAARAYDSMSATAKAEGVILVPLSGFRSVQDQDYLFFEIKAERGQSAQERAEVSAPPGHSEHHTGYAIDIGDASQPQTHLSQSFEQTPGFQWLQANAAHFSFELSFPRNNPQGVSYEPWHWRFVGDRHSLETFYNARNAQPGSPNP